MVTRIQAGSLARVRTEPESWLRFNRASPVIDSLFAAYVAGSVIFATILQSLTPILIALATPLYCLLRWERVATVLLRCWPILLLPAFALTSALWSEAPAATLRYGIFYLLTIMPALFIGAGSDRLASLKGMFAIFAIYTFASLVFGRYVSWGVSGIAFAGLAGSKNMSGDLAALTMLLATTFGIWAMGQRRLVLAGFAVLTLLAALYALFASKATGALLAAGMAIPCILLWTASRRLPVGLRTAIFALTVLIAIGVAASASYWMAPLFDMVLENSGKDQGLTGRDFLWSMADRLIVERPLLGGGYRHFWLESNLDAQYVWREMMVPAGGGGFNFHNTPRDILVDLGIVGLILFTMVMIGGTFLTMFRTMLEPYYMGIFLCALIVFQAPRLFFELVAFQNMHYSTLLVFMILAYGVRPAKVSQAEHA
ncbi:O-antigen ligase family protein [Sphingomonas qomolangmaensis]|uniref:O-antigen ligase family protein n=1 Tax=Sphingomonas qomolangmaensis TaxID=2918765 RepID=A0ABY5L9A7_9SPHN|nr:O-antigen ligase family protein [Sphingomonas qomolangmaensis]UUL82384.1 O-antigen ligase family protein [Sphingomonas qomolangmaensis]